MISLSTAVRRMSAEAIPTDCMTLTRWILREAKEKSRSENVTGELTQLLSSIQSLYPSSLKKTNLYRAYDGIVCPSRHEAGRLL